MYFRPKNLKSERNNPWFKQWFNILLHTQCVCHSIRSMFRVLGIYNFDIIMNFYRAQLMFSRKKNESPISTICLSFTKYYVIGICWAQNWEKQKYFGLTINVFSFSTEKKKFVKRWAETDIYIVHRIQQPIPKLPKRIFTKLFDQ